MVVVAEGRAGLSGALADANDRERMNEFIIGGGKFELKLIMRFGEYALVKAK